jgi:RHS repeat-associated protein
MDTHDFQEGKMRIARLKAVVCVAVVLAATNFARADVGRTPGIASVSPAGAATYNLPVWAPQGPNGLTPRISLDYNSQQGNGLVGVGWSLGGISSIERCPQTMALDGATREVKLDAGDKFCLDGVRLRLTSSGIAYGQPNSTYQTEITDFSEIKAVGTATAGGPVSFERRTKDGLTYYYTIGVVGDGAPVVHRWKMQKVVDRAGNSYTIQYSNQDAAGHQNPWKIRWTPDSSGSSTYVYLMEFLYETRVQPDQIGGYVAGFPTFDKNRLKTILVKRVNGGSETILRKYSLEYTTTSATRLSRLVKVTECADDTTDHCLSPTVFDYQNGSGALAFRSNNTAAAASIQGVGDFNGDGKQDIAFIANGQWKVLFGANGPLQTPVTVTGLTQPSQAVEIDNFMPGGRSAFLASINGTLTTFSATDTNNDGIWEFTGGVSTTITSPTQLAPQAIDYNGDGLADLVWVVYNGSSEGGSTIRQLRGRLNTTVAGSAGATFGPEVTGTNLPATPPNGGFVAGMTLWARNTSHVDINGDGREDLFVLLVGRNGTTISYFNVLFSSPTEFSPASTWTNGFIPNVAIGNFNDDRCTDVYNGFAAVSKCATAYPAEYNLPAGVITNVSSTNIVGWGDWNGDGRSDLWIKNGSNIGIYPSTGTGFGPLEPTGIPIGPGSYYAPGDYLLDLDGDNVVDLARVNGGAIDYYTRANGTGSAVLYTTHIPDLMSSVTDGYGIATYFDYVSTAQNNYLPGTPAVAPLKPIAEPMIVVGQVRQNDGIGGTYARKYTYVGAREDQTRGSFAGFEEVDALDLRNNVTAKTFYEQAMPTASMVKKREVLQSSGRPISRVTYTNTAQELSGNAPFNQRWFQFPSETLEEEFDFAGPVSGATPMTTIQTKLESIDYAYGNVGKVTRTVTDGDSSATSLDAGKSFTRTTTTAFEPASTSNWCIGLINRAQVDLTATGETPITTVKRYTPDITNCRFSHEITETANGKYDVDAKHDFDAFGNLQTFTLYGKKSDGTPMTPRVTTMTSDATGTYPATVENAVHAISHTTFDDRGYLATSQDPNQLTTVYEFDAFGRRKKVTRPDGTRSEYQITDCAPSCFGSEHRSTLTVSDFSSGASTPRVSTVTYMDRLDRPIVVRQKLVDGREQWTESRYNNLGRLEKQGLPCQTVAVNSSCTSGWREFKYDDYGRITELKRPPSGGGASPVYSYSYVGRTTTVTDPLLNQRVMIGGLNGKNRRTIDANSYAQTFTYDLAGSLKSVVDSSGRALFGATYAYGIDALQLSRSNASAGTINQDFNSLGELTSWNDARGTAFTADYDAVSRMISQTEVDNTITFEWGSSVANHDVGLLTKATSTAGGSYSMTNQYDAFGRLRYQDYAIPGDATYRYQYAYDAATGYLDTLTYPVSTTGNQLVLKYGYTNDFVSSIGVSGTNQVIWSATASDIRGQFTGESLGTNIYPGAPISRTRTFDPVMGWPDTFKAGTSTSANAFEDGRVFFDAVGNLTQRQNNKTLISENFIYGNSSDHLYRLDHSELVGGANPGTNLTVTYDDIGDVDSVDQARVTPSPVAYSITWNRANYPTRIEVADEVAQIAYGPQRQRWKMDFTSAGTSESTYYIGPMMEKVIKGGTTTYRHYVTTPGGVTALFSRTSSSAKWRFLFPDHLGSVNTIVDGDGGASLNESFRAFGERRNAATWDGDVSASERTALEDVSRAGFTSQTMLSRTGLIHMNGRLYDANSARFVSPDPLVADPSNPQSYNRYSYVNNNPLSLTDPTGFQAGEDDWDDWGPTPWDEDCVWWRVKLSNGLCVDRNFDDGPTFGATGLPDHASYSGPDNIGATSDSTNALALVAHGGYGDFLLEQLKTYSGYNWWHRTAFNWTRCAAHCNQRFAYPGYPRPEFENVEVTNGDLVKGTATVAVSLVQPELGAGAIIEEQVAIRAPAATLAAAERIGALAEGPAYTRTVGLLETQEGPTLVGAGASDLNAAQKALAEKMGYTVVPDFAGVHAEGTLLNGAGVLRLTPTQGVVTNKVCYEICRPMIEDMGGWVNGKYFGFGPKPNP